MATTLQHLDVFLLQYPSIRCVGEGIAGGPKLDNPDIGTEFLVCSFQNISSSMRWEGKCIFSSNYQFFKRFSVGLRSRIRSIMTHENALILHCRSGYKFRVTVLKVNIHNSFKSFAPPNNIFRDYVAFSLIHPPINSCVDGVFGSVHISPHCCYVTCITPPELPLAFWLLLWLFLFLPILQMHLTSW